MRLIAAFLLIATFFPLSGQAGILCARNAKAVPVDPVFENKNDRCDGSVKVQAISYKCGSEAEAAFVMRSFLNDLQEEGEQEGAVAGGNEN
ncbi:MAG TPA: hypothetical protein PLH57_05395, partial [Oligoflexia bacterium]|nr:hypothetical protein [Oligoflexia bacterium]